MTDEQLARLEVADVRVTGGRIAECAPGLRPFPGEDDLDAAGAALLPGLHDHHINLRAVAAAHSSVQAGPPHVRTAAEHDAVVGAAWMANGVYAVIDELQVTG